MSGAAASVSARLRPNCECVVLVQKRDARAAFVERREHAKSLQLVVQKARCEPQLRLFTRKFALEAHAFRIHVDANDDAGQGAQMAGAHRFQVRTDQQLAVRSPEAPVAVHLSVGRQRTHADSGRALLVAHEASPEVVQRPERRTPHMYLTVDVQRVDRHAEVGPEELHVCGSDCFR